MTRMCFTTVANNKYQEYIPWFTYFIHMAYPDAQCMVFLDNRLNKHVKKIMNHLDFASVVIQENAFAPYNNLNALDIKYLRWLLYIPAFRDFDCLSMGDVDMAIFHESPSYAEQHLAHCQMTQLPYSNFVRPGRKVMGGINVVIPNAWFDVMEPVLIKYRKKFAMNQISYRHPSQNEQMLYQMISESTLTEPSKTLLDSYHNCLVSSNHHGIHIRNAELNGIRGLQQARNHIAHKDKIIQLTNTDVFKDLRQLSPRIGHLLSQVSKAYGVMDEY